MTYQCHFPTRCRACDKSVLSILIATSRSCCTSCATHTTGVSMRCIIGSPSHRTPWSRAAVRLRSPASIPSRVRSRPGIGLPDLDAGLQLPTHDRDVLRDWRLAPRHCVEQRGLPRADWRQPEFVLARLQRGTHGRDEIADNGGGRAEPIQSAPTVAGDHGLISATGTPRRVTSTEVPVRRTRSSTARPVALNSEIGMDSTGLVAIS